MRADNDTKAALTESNANDRHLPTHTESIRGFLGPCQTIPLARSFPRVHLMMSGPRADFHSSPSGEEPEQQVPSFLRLHHCAVGQAGSPEGPAIGTKTLEKHLLYLPSLDTDTAQGWRTCRDGYKLVFPVDDSELMRVKIAQSIESAELAARSPVRIVSRNPS